MAGLLAGSKALVTGARRSIGRGIALALAEAGCEVGINDLAADEDVRQTLALLEARGCRASFWAADIADAGQVAAMMTAFTAHHGTLDILVNNAYWAAHKPILEVEPEAWTRTLAVSLTGYFLCSQAAARAMVADGHGGSITSISSVHAAAVWPGDVAYGVAKAGIGRLTRSLAVELGRHGIRANVLLPGYMDTERPFGAPPPTAEPTDQHPPRGFTPTFRRSTPEDIGRAVVFLASAHGANISGAALPVDGGFLAT